MLSAILTVLFQIYFPISLNFNTCIPNHFILNTNEIISFRIGKTVIHFFMFKGGCLQFS